MAKPLILVVDDEAPVRTTLTKFLRSIGVERILEASNGDEALAQVRANAREIKLIIMDLKMPVKDGLKALQEIRGILPEAQVVILTGYPFYEQADTAVQKLGVVDFVVKPVDLDYLERIVSAVVS
jgi:YesN/AraC family two-component response regulator